MAASASTWKAAHTSLCSGSSHGSAAAHTHSTHPRPVDEFTLAEVGGFTAEATVIFTGPE